MVDFQELKVTYGALDRALLALGYALSLHETHRLYQHKASGSVYTLSPHVPMEQQVRPAHLLSLRHAVVHMGAADEASLRALLMEPTPITEASLHTASNGHAPIRGRITKPRAHAAAPSVESH